MTIHRCDLPQRDASVRSWVCPKCGASYVWSRRMIGRETNEGWHRTYSSLGANRSRPDAFDSFDRTWRWLFPVALVLAIVGAVVSIALYAGAAAWLWSLVP